MAGFNPNRRTIVGGLAAGAALLPLGIARAAMTPVRFLIVGDWGRDGAQHQRDVADRMGEAAAALGARFVLSVGDNFYENGVTSADDLQWRTSFEDIYTAPSLQVPWYVALGNHDYHGNPQAQIDYGAKSHRWMMPRRYYKVAGAAIGTPFADIFVIDSSPLVHKYSEKATSAVAANVASQDVDKQLAWLDEGLGASKARWKLVVGHHTIHSGGSGHGPTPELVAQVEPLLIKHKVAAYINGHDHDLQHIQASNVDYICCGAGSEVRPVKQVDGTLFCLERSGFGIVTLDIDRLSLEFRDYLGATVYRSTIPPQVS